AAPCNNGAVYFQDSSYSQQSNIIGWNWEFEPNHYSTLQNPVYVFYAADSCYDVRLIVKDVRGCVDTAFNQVCVPALFDFTFASSLTCFRDSTDFTPQLLAPSTDSLVFFDWNFGETNSGINNTSTLRNPTHYYSQPGTYSVSLQSIDIHNCIKKVYKEVVVLPLPVPAFSFTEGSCDSTIYFNESSSGSGSPISSWVWDYGDGNVNTVLAPASPDLPHKYLTAGKYVVGLTVTNSNGCVNYIADTNLLVKPCMSAAFSVVDTLICQNNTLSFADSSFSGLPATEWYWDFGDGTDTTYFLTTNPITHVFTTPGTFTVKMRISTDIAGQKVSDSTVLVVVVNPTPLPDFTNNVVCYKQQAVFTNMTSGNGTLISDFSWNFGEPAVPLNDTSTLRNPTHLYSTPGSYDVQLSAINTLGCKDSIQKTLVVFGLPDANFQYTLSCAGYNTKFTDLSVLSIAPIVDWKWEFSDTTGLLGKRDIQNPDFIFNIPGRYLVNLIVTDTNGCYDDTINQNIMTWGVPTSIYSYLDNFNDVQGQLQFTNISIDGDKYYWTFGNGEDSYSQNPVAFYQNDGTYDITLITWNDKECTDTLTVQYTFMVKGLYIPTAFSPENPKQAVRLLKPVGVNLSEYKFEVYDRWGNMLWWSDKLDESGRPSEGWDGTYNGVLMQEGTYVWKASAIFKDNTIWDADSIGNKEKLPTTKVGTATMVK
ncbi:MAG: PKD domain-containing protein, partial [Bacteroidales bacterium]